MKKLALAEPRHMHKLTKWIRFWLTSLPVSSIRLSGGLCGCLVRGRSDSCRICLTVLVSPAPRLCMHCQIDVTPVKWHTLTR